MADEIKVGPAYELTPGKVVGAGQYAVGNSKGQLFAVSRRCRHLFADLAEGRIDKDGCLVCPWHGARYDVTTGRMRRGPQGLFAKIPGVDRAYQLITSVLAVCLQRLSVAVGLRMFDRSEPELDARRIGLMAETTGDTS